MIQKNIELFCPTREDRARVMAEYSRYTVPILREIVDRLYILVKGCVVTGEAVGTFVADAVTNIQARPTSANKQQILDFLVVFLGDLRNFSVYLKSLSADDIRIWYYLMEHGCISRSDLRKIMGRDCITIKENSFGWRPTISLPPFLGWFDTKEGEPIHYEKQTYRRISEYYVTMPANLRSWLIPLFYEKEKYTLTFLPELPVEAKALQCFTAEPFIFVELSVLDGLSRQGDLATDAKWKLSAASVKKVASKMNMTEIFPKDANRFVASMRSNILLPTVAFFWMYKERNIAHPEKGLKDIFGTEFLNFPTILMPVLMLFTSGLRTTEIKESLALSLLKKVLDMFLNNKCADWLSVDQLLMQCLFQGISMDVFSDYSYSKMDLKQKVNGDEIYMDGRYDDVTVPFVKALFFLLASFGLVEIACDTDTASYPSPFHTLKYFRLTGLGRYVFGFTKTYEQPKSECEGPYFDLDSNNLIVRSLGSDNPYESLLKDIAEPIGQRRYKVTHSSLLNHCATNEDVANKVEFFKRFISSDLPKVWDEFFHSLTRRCCPLKGIAPDMYMIYQLDAGNEELLKLISTDPIIRKYTVRAEGHLLLVRRTAYKQVITRLKSFGYLL